MKISRLFIYPIKSTAGISVNESEIEKTGIKNDRMLALFDTSGQCLTAREYPQLFDISTVVTNDYIEINHCGKMISRIDVQTNQTEWDAVRVHSYDAGGFSFDHNLDSWFSDFLDVECRLLKHHIGSGRPVLEKHGGLPGDELGFNDQAPLLLISEASLQDLNKRLDEPVGMDRFRPNIVVSDCQPYEEDQWGIIQIGAQRLRVIQQCERCVMTTIDPETKRKHERAEPLKTLREYRKGPRGGLVLGVHAVPLNSEKIKVGDQLDVQETILRTTS